jgi:hypothetical protein
MGTLMLFLIFTLSRTPIPLRTLMLDMGQRLLGVLFSPYSKMRKGKSLKELFNAVPLRPAMSCSDVAEEQLFRKVNQLLFCFSLRDAAQTMAP